MTPLLSGFSSRVPVRPTLKRVDLPFTEHCKKKRRTEQFPCTQIAAQVVQQGIVSAASTDGAIADVRAANLHAQRMQALYDRETPLVDKMLAELDRLGFVEKQMQALTGESYTEEEKREAVREVVEKYFEEMSEGLLMVLAGYSQAAYGKGHDRVGGTLEMLREEILLRTTRQLPAEMQILDLLSRMATSTVTERVERLKQIQEQGYDSIPQTDLSSVRTMASQMLDDVEDKHEIIDRSLQARLCVIRDEIDTAARELGIAEPGSEYHELMKATWQLLPMGNAGFIKDIYPLTNPAKTRAWLERCLKDDFRSDDRDVVSRKWRAEGVRSGRLMNTIAALQDGLLAKSPDTASQENRRLAEIRQAALEILHELIPSSVEDVDVATLNQVQSNSHQMPPRL